MDTPDAPPGARHGELGRIDEASSHSVDKSEAAKKLGVSTRTLERLVASGRLKKGRTLRNGRPVLDFSEAAVAKLKAELEDERESNPQPVRREEKLFRGVSFRLDVFTMERLEREASSRGVSTNDLARSFVIRSLETGTDEHYAKELRALREALADTWFAFLVDKCGETQASADQFVKETILRDA